MTGTFRHEATAVMDVVVEGSDEPIGTTPNHPFWSEDRQEYVRADSLKVGERLLGESGPVRVKSLSPRGSPEPVFNIEVQCDHNYRVADAAVLVHNAFPCRWKHPPKSGWRSQGRTDTTIYRVRDKRTQQVVYVGQVNTAKGINNRFTEHLGKKPTWSRDTHEIQRISSGNWTRFEAASHEMNQITRYGGMGALENIKRPITPKKFNLYKNLHSLFPTNPF